MITTHSIETHC